MQRSDKLIINGNPRSPVAESYKTLRTNLQYLSFDNSLKSIIVTSCSPGEGKSTTAANLAISIAQTGKKVLLIDCDLRKPAIHKTFNIVNMMGLTNILSEGIDYREITNDVGEEDLRIITSGPKPPNPSELLGSDRMEFFLDAAKEEYNMVILDTPPLLPVTDASVLSRMADGIILVLKYGETTTEAATIAKAQLDKVGARILGAIINGIPTKGNNYYYNNYYYYYYDDDSGNRKKHKSKKKGKSLNTVSIRGSESNV